MIIFPWVTTAPSTPMKSLKWQKGSNRYEIHVCTLDEMGLERLLPHCLDVKNQIDAVVSLASDQGPSHFEVFPRTLSPVLQTVWHVVSNGHSGRISC